MNDDWIDRTEAKYMRKAEYAAYWENEKRRMAERTLFNARKGVASKAMKEYQKLLPRGQAVAPDIRLMTDEQLSELFKVLLVAEKYDWKANIRPDQVPPTDDWAILLVCAGRGYGKTKLSAEMVREFCQTPNSRVAVIGKDHRALRDVCLEGVSGILSCVPPDEVKKIHKGLGDVSVELINGSTIKMYTAGEPDAIRGQSFGFIWADEFASWPRNRAQDMLDQARMCLRESENARAILSTTPKRVPHVTDLFKLAEDPEERILIMRGTSRDNPLLTPEWHRQMERKFGGTRLGRQELLGELVLDVDNCLWTGEMLEAAQWEGEELPPMIGTLTGIDPSGSSDGDATGIVTIGWDKGKTLYVLENKSTNGTPDHRYSEACRSMHRWSATEAWVEAAYGGDHGIYGVQQQWMALQRLGEIPEDKPCPWVRLSTIKGDKAARAMPVVALLEQQMNKPDLRRIWFDTPTNGNGLAALADELLGWDTTSKVSPNAMDALVHACRQAMRKLGMEATVASPASPLSTRRIRGGGYNPYGK